MRSWLARLLRLPAPDAMATLTQEIVILRTRLEAEQLQRDTLVALLKDAITRANSETEQLKNALLTEQRAGQIRENHLTNQTYGYVAYPDAPKAEDRLADVQPVANAYAAMKKRQADSVAEASDKLQRMLEREMGNAAPRPQ